MDRRCEALTFTGERARCTAPGELRSDGRVRCWVCEQAVLGGFRPVVYAGTGEHLQALITDRRLTSMTGPELDALEREIRAARG